MPILTLSGSTGSEVVVSELKRLNTDPPSSHSIANTAETGLEEMALAQTEIDVFDSELNVEIGENALTTEVQESTRAEPTEDSHGGEDIESSDTVRTLERYKKAIERIKKALELRRESWVAFELSGFESLPLGGQGDVANLQLQLDKVLESRMNNPDKRSKWGKTKHILEQCFRALAPFTKNVLSVGMSAVQVPSTTEIRSNAEIPIFNPYGLVFGGILLLVTVY
jgi:hypothetical protein